MPSENEPMRGRAFCLSPLPRTVSVSEYPGMLRKYATLLKGVSCVLTPDDDDWMVVSPDGRLLRVPANRSGDPVCGPGVALAMAELRVTMGGGPVAFAIQEGTGRLWHRSVEHGRTIFHPIASVESEFGITASERMSGIDEFVRHGVEQVPEARLVLGVKFANKGFCRTYYGPGLSHTTIVGPDDPRFHMIWALDLSEIAYATDRVKRFQARVQEIVYDMAAGEMLSRVIAAPVCAPFMHGVGVLSGPGGNGKGRTIKSTAALYGRLAAPFNLASLLGVSRSSSTTNDQASVGLLTGLLAFDSDAVNPGQGIVENLKKAAAGEELSMRLLQQNVAINQVTAFMLIATNRGSTLPSTPEWRRRIWSVPFRSDVDEKTVLRWSEYLGDGTNPNDGIIDALMAGAASFAAGRPDPETSSQLTEGLTTYGRTLLDLLMSCGPLQENGLPDRPRVAVKCPDLLAAGASEKERRAQMDLMGLDTASQRDIHHTLGDDGRTKQVVYVKDPHRFGPFAKQWRDEQRAAENEREVDEHSRALDIVHVRNRFLDTDPLPAPRPGVAGQLDMLRSVKGMTGTVLTPTAEQWNGKGMTARWQTNASIRHDLDSCDPADVPPKYGLSVAPDLLVMDCDPAKPGKGYPESGLDALLGIPDVKPSDLDTLVMRSQHGVHLVWRLPAELVGKVKASTHVHDSSIDLRPGGKSYVIGPGSHWTDQEREHAYPGVVSLPPLTPIEGTGEPPRKERRIPMLPKAIADWIMSDPKCVDRPSRNGGHVSRFRTRPTGERDADGIQHVDIPPMGPGDYHDPIRTATMRVANRAKNRGWTDTQRDAEMDRIRAAANGHDSKDTQRLIDSAIHKVNEEN